MGKNSPTRNKLLIVLILLALSGIVVVINRISDSPEGNTACAPYRTDKVLTVGQQKINVELASTKSQREKGLGGRSCIDENSGMLFVFEQSGKYRFWMRDMKFPIDIIWIDENHKLVAMAPNVSPSTYPDSFINEDESAQYVLELKAGKAQQLSLQKGTLVNF